MVVLSTPRLVGRDSEIAELDRESITREIDDARVWSGRQWRHSMHDGNQIGRKVARHVSHNFFRPRKSGD